MTSGRQDTTRWADLARNAFDLGRWIATKRQGDRANRQAVAELEERRLELPRSLRLTWLGTAGYRLDSDGHTLLVDPFLTRVPQSTVVLHRKALPDPSMIPRYLPGVGDEVHVVASHGHWDHALDTPAIARKFHCLAYGSESLMNLMSRHGLGDSGVLVTDDNRQHQLGPFTVTFVPSRHAKVLLGLKVPSDFNTRPASPCPLSPTAYGCGRTWGILIEVGGFRIYHQGSPDLIDDAITSTEVDLLLAAVTARFYTPSYWPRLLTMLCPATVVPMHYDAFTRPLDEEMGFSVDVRLDSLVEEIAAVSRSIGVSALPRVTPSGLA